MAIQRRCDIGWGARYFQQDGADGAAGEGGRLRVDLSNVKNNRVAVRLQDNGPGISATEAHRLFKPFYTAKPGGTGLGLALVHRIVEAHGGEVEVEGRPGIGAAFTVSLPAESRTDDGPV